MPKANRHTSVFPVFAFLVPLFSLLLAAPPASAQIQGYGVSATGGAGGQVCTVTNTAATGAGSFSDCARRGNVMVQFNGPGPFIVDSQQTYLKSNTTIDGCANGQNGVTLSQPADVYRAVVLEGPASNLVIRCIRFQGSGKVLPNLVNEHDLLAIDGNSGLVSRVSVDRCTFLSSTDGALDIVGDVQDVTVQKSLFYNNPMTMLIKYGSRNRISIHHNVYTANAERNPQIKGDALNVDFVSNAIYNNLPLKDAQSGTAFSPYGTLLWNGNSSSDSPGNVNGNFRSNAWIDPNGSLKITTESGASAAGIYLSGNYCQPGPCLGSPATAATSVPAANVVTATAPGCMVASMFPTVGAPNRTATDTANLNSVAAVLPNTCGATTPSLSIGDVSVSEGNSGTRPATFTVTLSAAATSTVTVNYATANGTATAGSDYVATSGTLSFPAGTTTRTIAVTVNGDTTGEPNETFLVNLSNPTGATLADGQATGTIVNDDGVSTLSIGNVSISEGNSGTKPVTFTVTLSAASASPVTVAYATANGTATAGSDYTATAGTLSFPAGTTTRTLSVTVNGDTTVEPNETFMVNLSGASGATLLNSQGTATLVNDDGGTAAGAHPVTWTSLVGVTASGNSLRDTAATGANAGAASTQRITSGDGYVEFTAAETTTNRMLGLSNGNTNATYADVDFGIGLAAGAPVYVLEKGTNRGTFGTYRTGDVFRVAVVGGVVKYFKNGVAFYTSTQTRTYPLLVDTWLDTLGATLNNVMIQGQ